MNAANRSPMRYAGWAALAACALTALSGKCLLGQEVPPAQAADEAAPAAQPVAALPADAVPIEAVAIGVQGRAFHAPVGTEVTDAAAWQPVRMDDRYPAGTLIRTGLGSHVVLQFGQEEPYTVVMVERLTMASIAALHKTDVEKVSNVTVNYGAVRGGVSEGGLRSSFVVDSAVATLTKRGTWGFRLFVERGTGRFEMSLAEEGLLEALNRITSQRQTIGQGQYLTQAMRRWVEQTSFDRLISLQDPFGMTGEEIAFKAFHNSGLAAMDAGPSFNLYDAARPGYSDFVRRQVEQQQQAQSLLRLRDLLDRLFDRLPDGPSGGIIRRPEGDFGGRF